ncbi:MAG TPA: ATP-binding cassette domain-containing protein [Burkholderiales bacterium]|nr:ATP-binding cassette domain-containing protein [Burkholderiales bacterium]
MPVVEVQHLSKTFGAGELAVHALKDASFSVEAGELAALLGPSGSGKSTLLLCMGLILEPTAALDTDRGGKVMGLLRRIARERRSTVIVVTHDRRMIEGFDTVYHLSDGALLRAPLEAVH